jgi:hypothetical protein
MDATAHTDFEALRLAAMQAQRETGLAGSKLWAAKQKLAKAQQRLHTANGQYLERAKADVAVLAADIPVLEEALKTAKTTYAEFADKLKSFPGGKSALFTHTVKAKIDTAKLAGMQEDDRLKRFRSILATGAPEVLQKLVEMAKGGDVAAIKVIADKLIPTPKPVEVGVKIDLPGVDRAEAIFRAITDGRIGVEAGGRLLQAVAAIEEARANADVAVRIAALEAKVAQGPQQPATGSNVIRIPAKAAPKEASAWSAGE